MKTLFVISVIILNSCLVEQNLKIALITIEFIVGSFENFGSLEKSCLKKKNSNVFFLAAVKNQRENKL